MPPVYTTAELNNRLNQVIAAIDAGGSAGKCNVYGNAGNLLVQLTLQGPPCGTAANGVLTFSTPWVAAQAIAAGTPASAQIIDSNGNLAISGLTAGTIGSTSDIVFAATLDVGETVIINSATITGH